MSVTVLKAVPAVAVAGAVTLKWSAAGRADGDRRRAGEARESSRCAVRLLEPAAKRVADSVVVLTPLVNETVLVG